MVFLSEKRMAVTIITMPADYHALAVKWALEKMGVKCTIVYPFDLVDQGEWSWSVGDSLLKSHYRRKNNDLDANSYETIWFRRPPTIFPLERLKDSTERLSAETELSSFVKGIYNSIETGKFSVNAFDKDRAARRHLYQLETATSVGLAIPETLITNSKEHAKSFALKHKSVVYKPISKAVWQFNAPGVFKGKSIIPTTVVDACLIDAADIASSPVLLQENITKRSEVRATVMGSTILAYQKTFPSRSDLDVDWRFMHKSAVYEKFELPAEISKKCINLMNRLGIVFGCIDLLTNDDGIFYFLEVNPQGQWLFGDTPKIGLNQLSAMCAFLQSKKTDFQWDGNENVFLKEFDRRSLAILEESEARSHFGRLNGRHYAPARLTRA
jgi:hypothetical protein